MLNEPHSQYVDVSRLSDTFREDISYISKIVGIPHTWILTNSAAVVTAVYQHADFDCRGLSLGHALDPENAGINAISTSLKDRTLTVVSGEDHTDVRFKNWSCICSPIVIGTRLVGFLDLSVDITHDLTFAVALVGYLAQRISVKMVNIRDEYLSSISTQNRVLVPLTIREWDVSKQWALHKTANEIGDILCISPATVRTHIKRIYAKIKVNNKAEFLTWYMRAKEK